MAITTPIISSTSILITNSYNNNINYAIIIIKLFLLCINYSNPLIAILHGICMFCIIHNN